MIDGTRLILSDLIRLRTAARGLELGARRRTLSVQAGGYRSIYHGRGMEFDEVRAYQPGDDLRTIDWRVTARRGRVHTKLFREERERPVFFLADLHPGMFFGSRVQFKSVLAGRLIALLGWAAVKAGDRVGGIVHTSDTHKEIYPAAREAGLLPLLRTLVQLQPDQPGQMVAGRMDRALMRLSRIVRPGSLVIIFSDFREAGPDAEKLWGAIAQHNDVITGFLYDPLEASPPPAGLYRLGTQQHRSTLDTSRTAVQKNWQQQFDDHRNKIRTLCHRHAIHFIPIATTDDLVLTLRAGLTYHGKVA